MTISECEKKINYLSDLSPSAEDDVRSMKAELFFRKATLLHESNFFIDALRYYEIALSNDRGLSKLIDKRIDSLIQGILEKSTGYQNENELLLAVESLKVVSSLDKELSFKLSPLIFSIEQEINQIENQKTQQIMQNIIRENKSKNGYENKELIIGMSKDKVIDYINMPDSIDFITSSLDSYEIWIYSSSNKKLFFKNNKLHHIQSIKE